MNQRGVSFKYVVTYTPIIYGTIFDTIFLLLNYKKKTKHENKNLTKALMDRLVLYPKDVARIIGKKDRAARNLIMRIKSEFNKDQKVPITVPEFCAYMKMDVEFVLRMIR